MEAVVNYKLLESTYKSKKVFITGHTGFKGSWLTAWLHLLGASLKGYAIAPEYENSLFSLLEPLGLIESILHDIRDRSKLIEEINLFQPDLIFHLAAQPLVRRSYEIPAETFDINVTGTANVLEAVKQLQKKCTVVIITTDKVYENKEQQILYKETDVLGGYDPYSASKACAEMVVSSFRNSFFNLKEIGSHKKAVASVRAGNVIGGGDWNKDRIIPDIIRALQEDRAIEVRNPSAVRPWQHVIEPLGGYLLLGSLLHEHPEKFSGAYNFGPYPQDHLSVRELVSLAIHNWGNGEWKDISDKTQPHEAGLLQLDITKAIAELNWKPKFSAAKSVEWTIDWYKQPIENQAKFVFRQINEYIAL